MQDSKICCLRFYNLAPFMLFNSFSHPFLPCRYLFTFCILLNEKSPPFVPEYAKCGSNKFVLVLIAVVVAFKDTIYIFYYEIIKLWNNFAIKSSHSLSYIEISFSPWLTDYFIQGWESKIFTGHSAPFQNKIAKQILCSYD